MHRRIAAITVLFVIASSLALQPAWALWGKAKTQTEDGDARAGFEPDLLGRQQAGPVVGQLAQLANVLVQVAAEHDVDQLRAAADAEPRKAGVGRLLGWYPGDRQGFLRYDLQSDPGRRRL